MKIILKPGHNNYLTKSVFVSSYCKVLTNIKAMGIKSHTLFIVILITLVSISCRKSSIDPTTTNNRAITGIPNPPNNLIGTWALKSHKSIPLSIGNLDYQYYLKPVGKDTIVTYNLDYQYFDSMTFNRDSSFYGHFNSNGNQFAMSGQWSVSDSVLTLNSALINNGTQPNNYWFFDEKEGKSLALVTPVLKEITGQCCDIDISFEKDEISYIKVRE